MSNCLRPHGLQHTRLLCPPLSTRVCSKSCPLNQWCYLIISSSATLFSFCLQYFPASGSFPMSWIFLSSGQSIGDLASASILPMNIQGWYPFWLAFLISLLSKGLSRVFSNTTIQKHQFYGPQPSLWTNSYICTWPQQHIEHLPMLIFWSHIFLHFHAIHGARILGWVSISFSREPCLVRTLHYDPAVLGGPAQHGS